MNLIPTLKSRLEFDEYAHEELATWEWAESKDKERQRFGEASPFRCFTDGGQAENARLAPIHAALIEIVELFELECKSNVCICKLNPYVGVPVPCETCRMNTALKNLKHVLEDTSNG